MWAQANVCVSAILLIIYIFIFGQQSINKYIKKGVIIVTIGIFRRNEYIPCGNDLVPYENAFIPRGNELIPTSCWNLHKPKLPKIKTF